MAHTTNRRPATAADLVEGATVYKGKGKVAHTVSHTSNTWGEPVAWLRKVGNKPTTLPHWCEVAKLTVDA
jgi:hypothetical protein